MKKVFLLLISLQLVSNLQADYRKADQWYRSYSRDINSNMADLLAKYAICRVQEVDAWLKIQRRDISGIEYEIADALYRNALEQKRKLENEINSHYYGSSIVLSLRTYGNNIAQERFATEMLSSLFVNYKTGKRAAAKVAKRDFFFECYKLLKNRPFSWFGY